MKVQYDFINCANKKFSDDEFKTLRNEQEMRIKMVFSQGFTLAGIVLVFWAAIFAFCKDLLDIINTENSIIGKSAIIDCVIALVIIFFCSVPTLLTFSFSVKYHDNIRQIVSIANYIRVFYEYPTLIAKNSEISENDKNEKTEILGWETLHCNHNIPHGKYLAYEYNIIAAGSTILTIIFTIALFSCLIGLPFINESHIYIEGNFSIFIFIIGLLISLFYISFLIFILCKSRKNVNVDKLFKLYGKIYFEIYVEQAEEIGLIGEEQKKNLLILWKNYTIVIWL